jgi:tetratricopeptide (TPR) repeat protein/glycosyltransferase involved in cell wall biosynthesis
MSRSVDKYLLRAQKHISAGQLTQAKEIYKEILSQFPKNKKALKGYQKLTAPNKAEVGRLISLFNNGDFKASLSYGEMLSRQFPRVSILYEIIAASNMSLGVTSEAIRNYRKVLEISPKHLDAHNNLGTIFYTEGNFIEAVEHYQKAVEIEPRLADVHYNLGNALKQIGDLTQAIESYAASIAINPDDAEVSINYGHALKSVGKFDQAIEVYAKVSELRPDLLDAKDYMCIGSKALEQGSWAEGLLAYDKGIKVNKGLSKLGLLSLFLHRLKYIKNIKIFVKVIAEITAIILPEIQAPQFSKHSHTFLASVVFSKDHSKEQMDILFENWIVPWINHAYDMDMINVGMNLEAEIYSLYVKNYETEEHFGKSTSMITDGAVNAGRRHQTNIDLLPKFRENKIRKIGFFVHNASMLAHIQNLFEFLKAANKDITPDFKAYIFCFNNTDDNEMVKNFTSINVEIIRLDIDDSGQRIKKPWDRIMRMRDLSHSMEIHTMVWISLVIYMALVFSMRIAPQQIWWCMKWPNFFIPCIDKRLFYLSFRPIEILHNQKFLSHRMQFSNLLGPNSKDQGFEIKKLYSGRIILGTMGRTEKIKDPLFLNVVCEILKQNSNAIFMWTGRSEDESIKTFFEWKSVEKQVKFIGWVDTRVYAHVFDIHLDSFPAGNGVTALQSMAAATPVVNYKSNGIFEMISPLFNDFSIDMVYRKKAHDIFFDSHSKESYYLSASDRVTYIEMVQRLINDQSYRRDVGTAYRRFVREMMSNPTETSQIITKHLLS